ncbi:hypothetical protein, variant [Saprolegnia diclina VS20]|uniref:Sister chromatid cohesion protein PDS5 n=1 Tax=Saprolegnia diclina (strain VS20) TaxID=1156394 RepID=T0QLL2_SAPDV|nr:hypothetical protein, variant [Saprolegnia diclina VS20]EQC35601.1 hypothetical protein, variant [Saprolegnia diclina VS20]|eukprot:XP_008610918.1 hypothetical protein, variant [Saprolegnia diclina VS20]
MARPKQAPKGKGKSRQGDPAPAKAKAGRPKTSIAQKLTADLERLRGLGNGDLDADEAKTMARDLSAEERLTHADAHVRLLVASCAAELLRLTAPETPFASDQALYDVFGLVIRALKESTKDTDIAWFGLLETLASVKSCNLMVGLQPELQETSSSSDLVVDLFRGFFERLQDDHSPKVEANMITIMVSCLEEGDAVSPAILEALLEPLLEVSKPRTYHMAQQVIEKATDVLQTHLSLFFNSALVDVRGASEHSALKEHIHALIYEVHKVNPSLLLYVLPNVCLQLQVDDLDTRSNAIALMGRLFASSHADYGAQYLKNFRDFLDRFRDVKKDIRLQMVQVCAIIAQRKPDLVHLIEPEMMGRLQDAEWDVRRLAMNELCDLAAKSVTSVSAACLRQIGERMKDKKVVIRKEAMTGLAQIYSAHVANGLSTGANDVTAAATALSWVPDYVLKCFAYPQQELKLRVVQLLDDILLPKATSELHRMKGLVFLWKHLDSSAKEALKRIFLERVRSRDAIATFLDIKQLMRHKKNATATTPEVVHMMECLKELQPLLPETDGWASLTEKLALWKDMKLVKHLELLCAPTTSSTDLRKAREDVVKMLGSKTPLGEWMKNVCRKLAMLTINTTSLESLLSMLQPTDATSRDTKTVVDILLFVAEHAPFLFEAHLNTLEALLDDDTQSACVLDILIAYGKYRKTHATARAPDSALEGVLLAAAQESEGDEIVRKSARALVLLFPRAPAVKSWLVTLAKASTHEDTQLIALAILAKHVFVPTECKPLCALLLASTASSSHAKMKKKELHTLALQLRVLSHVTVYQFPDDDAKARSVLDLVAPLLTSAHASLRRVAAQTMLVLSRTPLLESQVRLPEWHALSYMVTDEDVGVREAILKTLTANLLRHAIPHPHKYTAMLALTVHETHPELKKTARTLLATAVMRLRKAFEARDQDDASNDEASSLMVPEYTLPFVLHLVLHPPSGCDKIFDAPSLLLDVLVSNVASEADNISFLLQMLHKMSMCHDATEPTANGLYKVVQQCTSTLRAKIKNQVNLKPYPGQIFLPKDLFQPGKAENDTDANDSDASNDDDDKAKPTKVHKKRTLPKATNAPKPKKAKPTPAKTKASEDDPPPRRMPSRRAKQTETNLADPDSDVDEYAAEAPASSIRAYFTPVRPKARATSHDSDTDDGEEETKDAASDGEEETKAAGSDDDDEDMTSFRPRRRR